MTRTVGRIEATGSPQARVDARLSRFDSALAADVTRMQRSSTRVK
ncbi:hypothetical protein P3102_23305 [Amycolatopsis sp. QT-25]|nr:hypothetical protein [Amycolatopsis sp. QT-25]WET77026.1 hypothetical protein P3102_23305 [Amycolatopsis sp. QT-25]